MPIGICTGGHGVGQRSGHWMQTDRSSVIVAPAYPAQYQWVSDEIPFVVYNSFTRYHRLAARYTFVTAVKTPKYEQLSQPQPSVDVTWEAGGTLAVQTGDIIWEALLELDPVATALYEALGAAIVTKTPKYEQLIKLAQTQVDAYEASGVVTQAQTDVYEALQGVLPFVLAVWEAVGGIIATKTPKYEQLVKLTPTQIDPWEALGLLTQTQIDVLESLQGLLPSGVTLWEALGGIIAAKTPKYEQLAKIAPTSVDPWEALQPLAVTVDDVWEALRGLLPLDIAVWEALGGIIASKVPKYEQIAAILQTQIDVLEALGLVPTNLMLNPTVEVNILCWFGTKGGETVTRDNAQALDGSWSAKVVTQNLDGSGFYWRMPDTTRIPATPGVRYKMQVDVFATGAAIGQPFYPSFQFLDAGQVDAGGSSNGTIVNLVAGWQRFTFVSNTAPATTAFVSPAIRQNGAIGPLTIWADNALLIPVTDDEVWESLKSASQSTIDLYEALGSAIAAKVPKYEQLARLLPTSVTPWEAVQLLAPTQVDVYEALLGLLPSAVVPWEAFAIINTGNAAVVFWESIGNLITSVDIFWDSCATFEGEVVASGSYGTESATAVIGTIEAPIATSYSADSPTSPAFSEDLPSTGGYSTESPTSPPCRDDV